MPHSERWRALVVEHTNDAPGLVTDRLVRCRPDPLPVADAAPARREKHRLPRLSIFSGRRFIKISNAPLSLGRARTTVEAGMGVVGGAIVK